MGPNWQKMGPDCHAEKWTQTTDLLTYYTQLFDFLIKNSGPVLCLKTGPDRIAQKSTGTRTEPDRTGIPVGY